MSIPDPNIDPATERPWTSLKLAKRRLARAFPRTARAYGRVTWKLRHLIGSLWRRSCGIGRTWRWASGQLADLEGRRSETRLTVAVDITPFWESLTGVGWYLYRLLEHLADRPDLRLRLYGPTTVTSHDMQLPAVDLPTGRAVDLVLREVPDDLMLPAGWIIRGLRLLEPFWLALEENEVLFAPNYFLPRRFTFADGALVATIHDLGSRRVPWTLQQETLDDLNRKLTRSTGRARRLLAVSGAVRDELVDGGYAEYGRIDVVYHGPGQLADTVPSAPPGEIAESFALHVGTLEPRKNISTLLDAWRIVLAETSEAPQLVLCGRFGWKADEIRDRLDEAISEGWLAHLGYVAPAELAALYHQATMVLFPSYYEGFGLPAVEAQWAGTPLICSDIAVLREIAGEGALFAPPDSPEQFAERVLQLLGDPELRNELVRRGTSNVGRLSWDDAADTTASAWYAAAGRSPSTRPS